MKKITMSRLGNHGRFANQIFQYMFLKVYAAKHHLEMETSPWIGENLFKIDPAPITSRLAEYYEPLKKTGQPEGPPWDEAVNRDFHGYAQYHTAWYRPYKRMIYDLLRVRSEVLDRLEPATHELHNAGRTTVGIHLRRGDYGRKIHYITPVQWYLDWLEKTWPTLNDPVLFIASEDRALVKEFADYHPVTSEALGIDLQNDPQPLYTYLREDRDNPLPHLMDFFPDFFFLAQCEILAIPNSTFSFIPAMLAPDLKQCWRSRLDTQAFEQIDPWDTTPLRYEMAEDYKHIEGVYLEHNPPHWP